MHDRPTAIELVNAVRLYLESELLPTLTDARLKFQTLIAANVLSIAEREWQNEEGELADEFALYAELFNLDVRPQTLTEWRTAVRAANERLCESIRRGDYDEPTLFEPLARVLRRFVERKLKTANPRYLAVMNTAKEAKS
jgi:Domain of unknown function (DUF6285)